MSTAKAIDHLVDRFIGDILGVIRRAQDESRAAALRTVTAMAAAPSRSTAEARAKRKPAARPAPAPEPIPAPVIPRAQPRARVKPIRATPATSSWSGGDDLDLGDVEPSSGQRTLPGAPEREAMILEAVRSMVRATAREVAERVALPNGSVYVALRSLVTQRKVAKTDTARGIEYSLVSAAGIRPFKRARAASDAAPTPAEATPPAEGPSPAPPNGATSETSAA